MSLEQIEKIEIEKELEKFRCAENSSDVRDALGLIAILLVDGDNRITFRRCDGGTTIVDHLIKLWEEQKDRAEQFTESAIFGFRMDDHELEDFISFTNSQLSQTTCDMGGFSTLFGIYSRINNSSIQLYILETFRNLCFEAKSIPFLTNEFIETMWSIANGKADEEAIVALDALCNIAAHNPRYTHASDEKIGKCLHRLFTSKHAQYRLALCDFLCNVSLDSNYSILMVYEMDEIKPHSYRKHSGIVYLVHLTEKIKEKGLKMSMESLAHNLKWSTEVEKIKIQKLEASNYMNKFGQKKYMKIQDATAPEE